MHKGWVKVYRELLEKPVWLKSTAESGKLFIMTVRKS